MRTVTASRYVTPFREGGSMPALVEAEVLDRLMDQMVRRTRGGP